MKQINITINDIRDFAECLPRFSSMTDDELECVYTDIGAMGKEADISEGQLLALEIVMADRKLSIPAYEHILVELINDHGNMVYITIDESGIIASEDGEWGLYNCVIPTSGTLICVTRGFSYVRNWEYAQEVGDSPLRKGIKQYIEAMQQSIDQGKSDLTNWRV